MKVRVTFIYFFLCAAASSSSNVDSNQTSYVMKINRMNNNTNFTKKSNEPNPNNTDQFIFKHDIEEFNGTNGLEASSLNSQKKRENFENSFNPSDLNFIFAVIDALPNSVCRNDSMRLLEAIKQQEKWAMQMFDSSPKVPVGVLHGSLYQLGNFDECIASKEPTIYEDSGIHGKYCLAELSFKSVFKTMENVRSISSGPVHKKTHDINDIRWAICVPTTCSPNQVKVFLEHVYEVLDSKSVSINVPDNNCYFEKDVPLSTAEVIFSWIFGIFILFVALTTIMHLMYLYQRAKHKNHSVDNNKEHMPKIYQDILFSFSIVQNMKKLLDTSSSNRRLECLSGIKFLTMSLIVCGHSVMFLISGPILNADYYDKASAEFGNSILKNNPLLVDTFLLVSGFLMCYLLLLELDKKKGKINLYLLYIARYIRLTPSYLAVIIIYCIFLTRMNSGPLWNSRMALEQERCLKSWWTNILYINNYVNTNYMCMFQSWYLAADTQLFMLSPIVIYPLWKWQKCGEIFLGIITFLTTAVPFIITYKDSLDPTLMIYAPEVGDLSTNSYFVTTYIKTHMRASSYFIGITVGYIIYKLQSSNTKISRTVVCIGWIMATLCGIISMFSVTVFYFPDHEYNALEAALYSALHRVAWSASMGWILCACVTDHAGPVGSFLSWSVFMPLSRLTYSAYLINGIIELYSFGTVRQPQYMSFYSLATSSFAHTLFAFVAALILCVLLESPVHGLEKILLKTDRSKMSHKNTAKEIQVSNEHVEKL